MPSSVSPSRTANLDGLPVFSSAHPGPRETPVRIPLKVLCGDIWRERDKTSLYALSLAVGRFVREGSIGLADWRIYLSSEDCWIELCGRYGSLFHYSPCDIDAFWKFMRLPMETEFDLIRAPHYHETSPGAVLAASAGIIHALEEASTD